MGQPRGIEQKSLAAPYLELVGSVFPENRQPNENGFIALPRRDFREAVMRRQQELVGSESRIPGDEQLLVILDKATQIRTLQGLAVLTRPSAGSLIESLQFRTFESSSAKDHLAEQLSGSVNHLGAAFRAGDIRLSTIHMFSYSSSRGSLNPQTAVEIQQTENAAPEEMQEIGMGHPGEQPFSLQYLIRFD